MSFVYIGALLVTLGCLAAIDFRYKLVFFKDAWRAAIALAIGVLIFSVWDMLGIHLGIFFTGQTKFITGLFLMPDYPIEELFFLTMLCYITLLMQHAWEQRT